MSVRVHRGWVLAAAVAARTMAACGGGDASADDGGSPSGAGAAGSTQSSGEGGSVGVSAASGSGASGAGGGTGSGAGGAACAGGDPFDPAGLEGSVQYLASDALEGRAPGTPGDLAARTFIEERFACLGLQPAGASFQQPFETSTGVDTANVVGVLPGSDPTLASEIIIVGAHHDHLGVIDGEIHNGANDNASGVAAMLAVADALQQRDAAPRRTVVFAAFGFEESEVDCEGSAYWAENPPPGLSLEGVVYMLNLDMVGTYPLEQRVDAYGSFAGTPARALLDELAGDHPGLDLALDIEADEGSSDFQAFVDEGVPYLYFETWDEDCYHSPCDDADHLDYPSMSDLSSLAFEVLVGLADSPANLAAASWDTAAPAESARLRGGRSRHGRHPHAAARGGAR